MYTKPVQCTSVHKAGLLHKCTQNQFTKAVYKKPNYCASIHKTSLQYKYTQNQFIMQVDTKPVFCTNVQKGWTETDRQFSILIMKGMYRDGTLLRNVQGCNITKECTGTEYY